MSSEVQRRATRQLAEVYEAFHGGRSHPSADEIYQQVRKTLPRISRGTVYRNLQRLVEEGKIRMLLLGDRVTRYEPMIAEHDHFICQQCRRVIDILLEDDQRSSLTPLVEQGFTITARRMSVHGLCPECSQRSSQKSQAKAPRRK